MLMQDAPQFSLRLQERYNRHGNPAAWRSLAWQRVQHLGLADKQCDAFQYVPLNRFYAQEFSHPLPSHLSKADLLTAVYPECAGSHFVIVDGALRLDLSDFSALPSHVLLLPLQEAFRSYANLLNSRFNQLAKEEKDPFALQNLSLHTDGAFLYIPPHQTLACPIQCIQISTQPGSETFSRLHVFVGAHSEARWISTEIDAGSTYHNHVVDIAVDEHASFKRVDHSSPHEKSWHFQALRASLKRNSRFSNVHVTTGSQTARTDYRVLLQGEAAEAELQGIAMLKKSNQAHTHVHMEHQALHTQSRQHFKHIAADRSQSSFTGKIYVHPEAQKTQAYQLNNHLILDEGAIANSKPNLEIFADDVKASHGATVAQIDPAQLFYLNSRGIDSHLAKRLLVSGFCQEILTQIPHLSIAQEMQILLNTFLQHETIA